MPVTINGGAPTPEQSAAFRAALDLAKAPLTNAGAPYADLDSLRAARPPSGNSGESARLAGGKTADCDGGSWVLRSQEELPGTLQVWGSSTFQGAGASSTARRCTTNMARLQRLTETNNAIGGSVLHRPNEVVESTANDGGYASVLQQYAPARADGPWLSDLGLVVMGHNNNDLYYLAGTQEGLKPFKAALRAVIDRARASAVFEDTHASVVLGGGTWATFSSTTRNSGAGYQYTAAIGATATITTPASYSGTPITIGSVCGNIPGYTPQVSATVNGQPWTITTPFPPDLPNNGSRVGFTLLLSGLPAGANTIVLTVIAPAGWGTTNFPLDYWQIEAEQPPLVLVPGAFRRIVGPTDAAIAEMNLAIHEVINSYADGFVRFVDFDAVIGKDPNLFWTDGLHVADVAHAKLAAALMSEARVVAAGADVTLLL